MPQAKIDGLLFKEMIQSGAALLTQNRESVDALNVFPVPDGDTGTNMSQTINSAVKEMQAKNAVSVGDVAAQGRARQLRRHFEPDPARFCQRPGRRGGH